jgi:very-short-patch-repair endonuclease
MPAIAASSTTALRRRTNLDWQRLRRIAARPAQRGHFTIEQAGRCGIDRQALARWTKRGMLTRESRGVYRFTVGVAPDWKSVLAGRLLATGGIACGRSAAALYGLLPTPRAVDILVARDSRQAQRPHHTTRELLREEVVIVDGLRSLHPVRTVLDVAHRVPRKTAVTIVEQAIIRKLVNADALERRARELRNSRRPGSAVVLGILADLHPELVRSRNEWEALVVRRARELGLPTPTLEHVVRVGGARYLLDAAWPDVMVALEFDGRDPHMRRRVHDYDNLRRNALIDAGWTRYGITATELNCGGTRTFARVARRIARRRPVVGRR